MRESWRPVLGYEGWYEASTEGRVRAIRQPKRGDGRCFSQPYPRVLTPLWYRKGYFKQQLGTCDGTREASRLFLHRIVYEAFHGPIPPGLTINHLDADRANNRLNNLDLATHLQQNHHARALGLVRWKTATGFVAPRLTDADVIEIRRAYAAGEATYEALAARFGVVKGTIGHILAKRSWLHI